MTTELFRDDSNRKTCTATVQATADAAIELDQTVFYIQGGGQAGDSGVMQWQDRTGNTLHSQIINVQKDRETGTVWHLLAPDQAQPEQGDTVQITVDWTLRYPRMQMHSALHLLCAVIPFGVTGGQIGEHKSRLDFDTSTAEFELVKDDINAQLQSLIDQKHAISSRWVDDTLLQQQPEIVRTMSVKPPVQASGLLRLVQIGTDDQVIDLQPCGGTHVAHTGEIGRVHVGKIENKGARNKRVQLLLG